MSTITMAAASPIRIPASGPQMNQDGNSRHARDLAFARHMAKAILATTTALTDNSTGAAQAANLLTIAPSAIGAANSGSNLADTTTTAAAFTTVLSATLELYSKANAALTKLGLPLVTYSGGGSGPTGTIAAVTKTVTGAATGATVATFNSVVASINTAHYTLAATIDKIATATGTGLVTGAVGIKQAWQDTPATTVAAITTTVTPAVSPGVLQSEAVATLTQMANNVATMAATLNTALAGYTTVPVVVI